MSSEAPLVLTPEGHRKIETELDKLRSVGRKEVADRIRDSKQFGEFTENSEYEDAKTEQAFVEGRIQDLRRILVVARVLDEAEIPTDFVGLGSRVTIRDAETTEDWELTLVGSVESDPDNDKISDESPVGQALLGKRVGDAATVAAPGGEMKYTIVSITK